VKDSPFIDTLFGINSVEARLRAGRQGIHGLQVRAGQVSARLAALVELAETMDVAVEQINDAAFDKLTSLNHQGVALQVTPKGMQGEKQLDDVLEADNGPLLLLILDGVTDPRNFGACLRSAATLGAQAVIVPRDNSAPLNAAAAKTASGGASVVPVIAVVNLARCMEQLKARGIWIVGTLLEAEQALDQVDLTGDIALVMGSEERGMRERTRKACDYLVSIPMPYAALGFNVSVATGICLYEAVRQRVAASGPA
jgi:23S rRNA (guanosine2251-2'-O)-methyltransferase